MPALLNNSVFREDVNSRWLDLVGTGPSHKQYPPDLSRRFLPNVLRGVNGGRMSLEPGEGTPPTPCCLGRDTIAGRGARRGGGRGISTRGEMAATATRGGTSSVEAATVQEEPR